MSDVLSEAARRRTFAIISHPDAGKTTLTEKFLLYGGALAMEAGSVKGKGGRRSATSDWMAMEQQRGISITSTVLQFNYRDCVVNLLDTPGHRDFSEDTYRVLAGCDGAVMVLDASRMRRRSVRPRLVMPIRSSASMNNTAHETGVIRRKAPPQSNRRRSTIMAR